MRLHLKKNRKHKGAFGWFQTLNPGNPEYNKDFFNMAMDTDGNGPLTSADFSANGEGGALTEAKADQENFIKWIKSDGYSRDEAQYIADMFNALKSRMKPPYNDIYYWIKKSNVYQLTGYLQELRSTRSGNQQRRVAKEGADLIYNKDGWKVYKINTYPAARYYGAGTKWCITGRYGDGNDEYDNDGEKYFNNYLKRGVEGYYFIIHGNDKWCYLDGSLGSEYRFWDARDNGIRLVDLTIPPEIPRDLLNSLPGFHVKNVLLPFIRREGDDVVLYYNDDILGTEESEIEELESVADIITKVIIDDNVRILPEYAFAGFHNLREVKTNKSLQTIEEYAFGGCRKLERIVIPNSVRSIESGAFSGCSGLTSITIPGNVTYIGDWAFEGCENLDYIEISSKVNTSDFGDDWNSEIPVKLVEKLSEDATTKSNNLAIYNKVAQDVRDIILHAYGTVAGHCIEATDLIIDELANYGIKAHYLEGYVIYDCAEGCSDRLYDEHNLVITEDNYIIDVTIDQFNDFQYSEYPEIFIQEDFPYGFVEEEPDVSIWDIDESLDELTEAKADIDNFTQWAGEDLAQLFFKLKPRIKSPENDIYYWMRFFKPADLGQFLDDLSNTKSSMERRREAKQGADLIYNKDGWKAYKINTYAAARYYGSGTKWCITGRWGNGNDVYDNDGEKYFYSYLNNGVKGYYFIIHGDDKWCYLAGDMNDAELWDAADNGLRLSQFTVPKGMPQGLMEVLPGFVSKNKQYKYIEQHDDNVILTYDGRLTNYPEEVRNAVTEIIVREDVDTVAPGIFESFIKLRKITFKGNKVKGIEDSAFRYCENLTKIDIPSTVKYIGSAAFLGCTGLREIRIPSGVDYIDRATFSRCINLLHVYIPDTVREIAERAFKNCTSLSQITIPKSVKSIKEKAFMGCDSLQSITLSEGLEYIGEGAFADCDSIQSLKIPSTVKGILSSAFSTCNQLKEVRFLSSLPRLSRGIFEGCENLRYIELPKGLKLIEDYALAFTKVPTISIPKDTVVEPDAFRYSALHTMYVPYTRENIPRWLHPMIENRPRYDIISEINGEKLWDSL